MATNSGGWLYEATGTPVDKATADNAQARVLEIKQTATSASADASKALQTANAYAGQIAQANTTAGEAKGIAQGAASDVDEIKGPIDTRLTAVEVAAGYAPGDATDAAMTNIATQENTEFRAALNAQTVQATEASQGLVVAGATFDQARLQSAATSAASSGRKLVAAGTITTDQTLTIKSDCDLSGLTINYTGSGVAVNVEGPTATTRLDTPTMNMPKVLCGNKPVVGWTAGTVGIRFNNLSAAIVNVPWVRGFETGMHVTAHGTGNVYNTFTIGALDNNKVNQLLSGLSTTGWINNNTFIGGRYAHYSGEGLTVPGTAHIKIDVPSGGYPINMNVWVNSSIETGPGIVEYGIDVQGGMYNVWQNPRVEANGDAPRDRVAVRWGEGSVKNVIRDGYSLNTKLRQVYAGGNQNYIDSQSMVEQQAAGATTPFRRYENSTTGSGPIEAYYTSGTLNNVNGYNPDTDWCYKASAWELQGKTATDLHPRISVDLRTGRTYYGSGTAALAKYFGNFGSHMAVSGSSLLFAQHNTYDLGSPSQAPQDVYAARYVRVGSILLRDNAGALEKSSNGGSTWTAV